MTTFEKIVLKLKFNSRQATIIELVIPVLLFLWTSWFAAFNIVYIQESFRYASFFNSFYWSLIFVSLGTGQIVTVYRGFNKERMYYLYLEGIFWLFWAVIIGMANHKTTGFPTYLCLSIAFFLSARRLQVKK